jgi:hypothetical protein
MDPLDRIGLLRFNQNFNIDFELTERGSKSNLFLRKVINNIYNIVPIGKTYLYDAII